MGSSAEMPWVRRRARGFYNQILSEYQKSMVRAALLATRSPLAAMPPGLSSISVDEDVPFDVEGDVGQCSLLFTTSRGLFVFDIVNGLAKRLLSGKFYGLAKYDDLWVVSRSNNRGPKHRRLSDISAVRILGGRVEWMKRLAVGIPGELHQVDIVGDLLYVPHTGYNQLLTIKIERLLDRAIPATIMNFGNVFFDIFRPSHLNSAFYDAEGDLVHLIAHNLTAHTGKPSDLLAYSRVTGRHTVQATGSHSAHNVFVRNGETIYCDSNHRRLVRDGVTIFEADKLLRGLSITDDRMYVGGSDVDFERSRRDSSDGAIYVLDRDARLRGTISFPGNGNLYEIRQLSSHDYAMSSRYQPRPLAVG